MAVKMTVPPKGKKLTKEEKWTYANFTNAYVFGTVLQNNPEITKRIIQLAVPDLEIDEIAFISKEKRQEISFLSKTSFLDIEARLKDGRIVLIEMQVAEQEFFVKRLRVYRSQCDVNHMKSGDYYKDLPDVIQIAICCFDPIGDDSYIYDCELYDKVNQKTVAANGQRLIILNAAGHRGNISDELKALLDYVSGKEASGDLVQMIDDSVSNLKYDETVRTEFMKLEDWKYELKLEAIAEGREEGRAEGLIEGREEGRAEGRKEGILNLYDTLIDLGFSYADAVGKTAEKFNIPASEITEIIQSRQTPANPAAF